MKRKILILIIAITVWGLPSCSDFLEMDKVGSVSPEEFYADDVYAANSIFAAYDLLQTLYGPNWNSIWQIKTVLSDEANAGGGASDDQAGFQDMTTYSHATNNDHIKGAFGNLYSCINRCNSVLEKVPAGTLLADRARAEAKCIRAYCYFELVTLWENVPLVLEILDAGATPSPNTKQEIYAQIEIDLNEAADELPPQRIESWRVTRGTALALLGKALVFQEKWTEAITALEGVEGYSLIDNYSTLLRKGQEFGSESLFEVAYSPDLESNGTFEWGNPRRQETNITWQLCGPRFVSLGTLPILESGWGHVAAKEEAWNAFVDAGDVVRRKARIMSDDELIAIGGGFEKTNGNYGWDIEGYLRLPYTLYQDEYEGDNWGHGTNFRIMRYAEVLLLLAEAYAEAGQESNAITALNTVRNRVGYTAYPSAPVDGEGLIEAIFSERQREFMFEGQRYTDVIRRGKGVEVFGHLGFEAGKHELLPIPADELAVNTNMQQNPGW